ncbi:UNKNOWN [Stylonychia lemnae]|uniref:Uncharacterized protein n=1 Tax=Stylonychia lemnae TaxID=5949 RepID=A0A078A2T7_STYLE|nr:UNKNOWN [Stylonychia lemnae]|eukprot:CDW76588.1 UNKNOWN [Stylonychia lemnae]
MDINYTLDNNNESCGMLRLMRLFSWIQNKTFKKITNMARKESKPREECQAPQILHHSNARAIDFMTLIQVNVPADPFLRLIEIYVKDTQDINKFEAGTIDLPYSNIAQAFMEVFNFRVQYQTYQININLMSRDDSFVAQHDLMIGFMPLYQVNNTITVKGRSLSPRSYQLSDLPKTAQTIFTQGFNQSYILIQNSRLLISGVNVIQFDSFNDQQSVQFEQFDTLIRVAGDVNNYVTVQYSQVDVRALVYSQNPLNLAIIRSLVKLTQLNYFVDAKYGDGSNRQAYLQEVLFHTEGKRYQDSNVYPLIKLTGYKKVKIFGNNFYNYSETAGQPLILVNYPKGFYQDLPELEISNNTILDSQNIQILLISEAHPSTTVITTNIQYNNMSNIQNSMSSLLAINYSGKSNGTIVIQKNYYERNFFNGKLVTNFNIQDSTFQNIKIFDGSRLGSVQSFINQNISGNTFSSIQNIDVQSDFLFFSNVNQQTANVVVTWNSMINTMQGINEMLFSQASSSDFKFQNNTSTLTDQQAQDLVKYSTASSQIQPQKIPSNVCRPTFYFDLTSKFCKVCPVKNCQMCGNQNFCFRCQDTFYYNSTTQKCENLTKQANQLCATFYDAKNVCQDSFFFDNSQSSCVNCQTGCDICQSNSQCSQCKPGYFYDTQISQCISDPSKIKVSLDYKLDGNRTALVGAIINDKAKVENLNCNMVGCLDCFNSTCQFCNPFTIKTQNGTCQCQLTQSTDIQQNIATLDRFDNNVKMTLSNIDLIDKTLINQDFNNGICKQVIEFKPNQDFSNDVLNQTLRMLDEIKCKLTHDQQELIAVNNVNSKTYTLNNSRIIVELINAQDFLLSQFVSGKVQLNLKTNMFSQECSLDLNAQYTISFDQSKQPISLADCGPGCDTCDPVTKQCLQCKPGLDYHYQDNQCYCNNSITIQQQIFLQKITQNSSSLESQEPRYDLQVIIKDQNVTIKQQEGSISCSSVLNFVTKNDNLKAIFQNLQCQNRLSSNSLILLQVPQQLSDSLRQQESQLYLKSTLTQQNCYEKSIIDLTSERYKLQFNSSNRYENCQLGCLLCENQSSCQVCQSSTLLDSDGQCKCQFTYNQTQTVSSPSNSQISLNMQDVEHLFDIEHNNRTQVSCPDYLNLILKQSISNKTKDTLTKQFNDAICYVTASHIEQTYVDSFTKQQKSYFRINILLELTALSDQFMESYNRKYIVFIADNQKFIQRCSNQLILTMRTDQNTTALFPNQCSVGCIECTDVWTCTNCGYGSRLDLSVESKTFGICLCDATAISSLIKTYNASLDLFTYKITFDIYGVLIDQRKVLQTEKFENLLVWNDTNTTLQTMLNGNKLSSKALFSRDMEVQLVSGQVQKYVQNIITLEYTNLSAALFEEIKVKNKISIKTDLFQYQNCQLNMSRILIQNLSIIEDKKQEQNTTKVTVTTTPLKTVKLSNNQTLNSTVVAFVTNITLNLELNSTNQTNYCNYGYIDDNSTLSTNNTKVKLNNNILKFQGTNFISSIVLQVPLISTKRNYTKIYIDCYENKVEKGIFSDMIQINLTYNNASMILQEYQQNQFLSLIESTIQLQKIITFKKNYTSSVRYNNELKIVQSLYNLEFTNMFDMKQAIILIDTINKCIQSSADIIIEQELPIMNQTVKDVNLWIQNYGNSNNSQLAIQLINLDASQITHLQDIANRLQAIMDAYHQQELTAKTQSNSLPEKQKASNQQTVSKDGQNQEDELVVEQGNGTDNSTIDNSTIPISIYQETDHSNLTNQTNDTFSPQDQNSSNIVIDGNTTTDQVGQENNTQSNNTQSNNFDIETHSHEDSIVVESNQISSHVQYVNISSLHEKPLSFSIDHQNHADSPIEVTLFTYSHENQTENKTYTKDAIIKTFVYQSQQVINEATNIIKHMNDYKIKSDVIAIQTQPHDKNNNKQFINSTFTNNTNAQNEITEIDNTQISKLSIFNQINEIEIFDEVIMAQVAFKLNHQGESHEKMHNPNNFFCKQYDYYFKQWLTIQTIRNQVTEDSNEMTVLCITRLSQMNHVAVFELQEEQVIRYPLIIVGSLDIYLVFTLLISLILDCKDKSRANTSKIEPKQKPQMQTERTEDGAVNKNSSNNSNITRQAQTPREESSSSNNFQSNSIMTPVIEDNLRVITEEQDLDFDDTFSQNRNDDVQVDVAVNTLSSHKSSVHQNQTPIIINSTIKSQSTPNYSINAPNSVLKSAQKLMLLQETNQVNNFEPSKEIINIKESTQTIEAHNKQCEEFKASQESFKYIFFRHLIMRHRLLGFMLGEEMISRVLKSLSNISQLYHIFTVPILFLTVPSGDSYALSSIFGFTILVLRILEVKVVALLDNNHIKLIKIIHLLISVCLIIAGHLIPYFQLSNSHNCDLMMDCLQVIGYIAAFEIVIWDILVSPLIRSVWFKCKTRKMQQ